jgi:hypothetical protein
MPQCPYLAPKSLPQGHRYNARSGSGSGYIVEFTQETAGCR